VIDRVERVNATAVGVTPTGLYGRPITHSLYPTRDEPGKVDGRSHALLEGGSGLRDHHVYLLVLDGYDDVPVLVVAICP
jgi:hypothetical protein